MTERRLFVNPADWSQDEIVIRGEQAHHLKDVLRARAGDLFEFIDGSGRWARAMIEAMPTRGEVKCSIQEQHSSPPDTEKQLVLMQALVRFEKFEWILEKATELGVSQIVPLITTRTEAKWREIGSARLRRWEKILVESLKQCRRLHLPDLRRPTRFNQAMSASKADVKLFLSEHAGTPSLKSVCRAVLRADGEALVRSQRRRVTLAIGPEGGWAREEEAFAERSGFLIASLGEGVLRAETAALAALVISHYEFMT